LFSSALGFIRNQSPTLVGDQISSAVKCVISLDNCSPKESHAAHCEETMMIVRQ
jgi:hypothetical protein